MFGGFPRSCRLEGFVGGREAIRRMEWKPAFDLVSGDKDPSCSA